MHFALSSLQAKVDGSEHEHQHCERRRSHDDGSRWEDKLPHIVLLPQSQDVAGRFGWLYVAQRSEQCVSLVTSQTTGVSQLIMAAVTQSSSEVPALRLDVISPAIMACVLH